MTLAGLIFRAPPLLSFFQLSTAKIEDSSANFHQDNTEHLPTKIMPAFQARLL